MIDVIIIACLLVIVFFAGRSIYKQKKASRASGCGGGCSSCYLADRCQFSCGKIKANTAPVEENSSCCILKNR